LPTIIAIMARLWMVLAELLGAGVALVFWRRRKPSVKLPAELSPPDINEPTSEPGQITAASNLRTSNCATASDAEAI